MSEEVEWMMHNFDVCVNDASHCTSMYTYVDTSSLDNSDSGNEAPKRHCSESYHLVQMWCSYLDQLGSHLHIDTCK